MKVVRELTSMVEEALLKVTYSTHLQMSKMSGSTEDVNVLRERIISNALNELKKPIEDFVENHFIKEVVDKPKELSDATNQTRIRDH
jgi:hypothetical protein